MQGCKCFAILVAKITGQAWLLDAMQIKILRFY